MQGSFEKDVQKKMDELRLTPSVPVWERIEVEIRAEKKKRRGLLWLLFAGLLTGGILYGLLNKDFSSTSNQIVQQTHAVPPNNEEKRETSIASNENIQLHKSSERQQSNVSKKENAQIKTNVALSQTQTKAIEGQVVEISKERRYSSDASTETFQSATEIRRKENRNETPVINKFITDTPEQNTPVTTMADKQVATGSSTALETDSIKTKTDIKRTNLDIKTDTVAKKKVALEKKWRKEFTVAAGRSSYAANNSSNKSLSSAPFYSSTGSSATGVFYAQPSAVSSGTSFMLGFSLVKKISRRWEISFGLQYSYASTHQKVGDKKSADTTVLFSLEKTTANGYYTNTATNDYTNRFHFIEVPVSVSFKASSRLPLYFSFGAAYGRLLSSNALSFSSASNLYYQNKQNNLRNALPIFSSVQMEFFGHQTFALRAGPYLQYNLMKAQKEAVDGRPHLLNAGIKAALIF